MKQESYPCTAPHYSGITDKLLNADGFRCKRCVYGQLFREVVDMKEIMISSPDKLECIDKFGYLGDSIGAGGEAEETSTARVQGTGSSTNIRGSFSQSVGKSL